MRIDDLKQGFDTMRESFAEGWQRLRQSAAGAFTRFTPGEKSAMPAASKIDDAFYMPSQSWAMVGGDVFEDERRLVVRLELPGMAKEDLDIEVQDDTLVVRGEKRFESETTEGRYRVLQCAYGSFRRAVPLPVRVQGEQASAQYKDGVLRVELPKAQPGRPGRVTVPVR
jgi:HSP20 family protein